MNTRLAQPHRFETEVAAMWGNCQKTRNFSHTTVPKIAILRWGCGSVSTEPTVTDRDFAPPPLRNYVRAKALSPANVPDHPARLLRQASNTIASSVFTKSASFLPLVVNSGNVKNNSHPSQERPYKIFNYHFHTLYISVVKFLLQVFQSQTFPFFLNCLSFRYTKISLKSHHASRVLDNRPNPLLHQLLQPVTNKTLIKKISCLFKYYLQAISLYYASYWLLNQL